MTMELKFFSFLSTSSVKYIIAIIAIHSLIKNFFNLIKDKKKNLTKLIDNKLFNLVRVIRKKINNC